MEKELLELLATLETYEQIDAFLTLCQEMLNQEMLSQEMLKENKIIFSTNFYMSIQKKINELK